MKKLLFLVICLNIFLQCLCVSAIEYNISSPQYFSEGNPQIILINISGLELSFEGSLTTIMEINGTEYGLIFHGGKWKHFSKYPIPINEKNNSEFYSEIVFKANGIPENIKEGKLKIILKDENGTDTEIYNNLITIFNENDSGQMEFFCERDNKSYVEINKDSSLIHRYDMSYYVINNENDEIYYRFPVLSENNILINNLCSDLILNSSLYNVSNNETVRLGNLFDMKLEIIINDTIFPKIEYESIFKIINNDHKTGEKENIDAFVSYSIKDKTTAEIQTLNFTKTGINSYSATRTGSLILDEGEYKICGNIESIKSDDWNAIDPSLENNFVCKNITVKFDKSNISCNPSMSSTLNVIYLEKKNDILIQINNFTENDYLIKIIAKNIFSNISEENYFLLTENETIQEIIFDEYGIYNVSIEIVELSCEDADYSDNFILKEIAVVEDEDFGIETYVEDRTYEIGETVSIPTFVYNGFLTGKKLEVEISVKRNSSDGWEEIDILNEMNISLEGVDYSYFFDNWTIGNETITGYYKIQAKAKFNETNRYSYPTFYVKGIPDMGEENLTIILHPNDLRFGNIGSVFVDFYSGNRHKIEAVFVVYINKFLDEDKTKYAAVDFDLTSLHTKIYESMASVKMNITRGNNYYLSLPLFINPNCNENYKEGSYRGVVRAYLSENRKKYKSTDFILELKSGNDKLCQKQSSGSSGSSAVFVEIEDIEKVKEIEYPETVYAGEEFEIKVDIKNDEEFPIFMEIYSYVFQSNKLLSDGLATDNWGKSWTANKQIVELSPFSGKTIMLRNKIKEDVLPGKYSLRVRKLIDGKKEDLDGEITVSERKIANEEKNFDTRNETTENTNNSFLNYVVNKSDLNLKEMPEYNGIPTGGVTGRQFDIELVNIIIALLRLFI